MASAACLEHSKIADQAQEMVQNKQEKLSVHIDTNDVLQRTCAMNRFHLIRMCRDLERGLELY